MPRISSRFRAAENTIEEIDRENDLRRDHRNRTDRDELVHRLQFREDFKVIRIGVASWKTVGTQKVHRKKDAV